uniref:Sushi domain-containing protein n=1 Tax=Esox lucius TaxID=8010 RepID=A0A6Q2XW17_ESOLU
MNIYLCLQNFHYLAISRCSVPAKQLYLSFVTFCVFPTAQASGRVCQRPQLDNGFVVPEQEMYQDGVSLTYACDRGLKTPLDGWWGTVKCDNGVWSHNPQCNSMCGEPPRVFNAVITQEYQKKFLSGSEVVYKCQTSYTLNGPESIVCISGEWTPTPTCMTAERDKGHGFTGRAVGQIQTRHCIPCVRAHQIMITRHKCGEKPVVDNGDYISDNNRMALTYKCKMHYELEGPEQVMCHSNGVWSETPVCKGEGMFRLESKMFSRSCLINNFSLDCRQFILLPRLFYCGAMLM